MTLQPVWRTRLFGGGAAVVAVWLGALIANQHFFWPAAIGVGLGLFALARWQPLPLSTVLLGVGIVGYVIGNRGFAQIMLVPNQPLLPAEAILMLCSVLLLVQCAWKHELPVRREPLNLILLAWIIVGSIRMSFDFRHFGLLAIRDFALVYYAAFFYLGQAAAVSEQGARWLERVLLGSCLVLVVTSFVYEQNPEFFLNALTFRGSPLIYYKGDLVGTFLAVGAVLAFLRYEQTSRRWLLALSLVMAGAVVATNNRASLLGLVVATLWLALGGRWKFAVAQVTAGAAAALLIALAANVMNFSLEKTPLLGVYERVVSLTDPTGQRSYQGEGTFNKGDNNLFRTVWWKTVVAETWDTNPYFGVGFGHDLADRFVREYYPESGEEFAVRSPHNVLITVFARTGLVGLALLIGVMSVAALRTWRAVRVGPSQAAPWCAAWILFTSACFGVVLEGPMGAVVFWIVLGWAQATSSKVALTENSPRIEKGRAAALPSPVGTV